MNKSIKKLEKWFFAFWVKRYKITYLMAFIILVFGIISLNNLPKESDPEINLPMFTITTVYEWVKAENIDSEVTEKIEESLADIKGISSIDSTSSEWRSSIRVEVLDGFDVKSVLTEVEDAVDGVKLPSGVDSDYPTVVQRDFTSSSMFSTLLYAKESDFTFEELLDISEILKQNTNGKNGIKDVTIDTNTLYDIRVILSKEKIDALWLHINTVSQAITNNNSDSPIGTYEISSVDYSFSLAGKIHEYKEILDIDLFINNSFIALKDIAEIDLYYGKEKINKFWKYQDSWYLYISLTYDKLAGANIFNVAPQAKAAIEEELEKSIYKGISLYYVEDESETITEDFNALYQSAAITITLVFLVLIFFVWLRESTIATFILPLAFLLAFIVVDYMWETLNQMTTFAFVLAFWIAIDTIIIMVEGAAEKVKQWYNARTATLIALREFKSPIIIGTLTTISAFIPVLTLPGIMGIFLAYIPLVVFITLVSTLFVSLTIAGAIFTGLSKKKKTYEIFPEREAVMKADEKVLLEEERKGKILLSHEKRSIREKIFTTYSTWYKNVLVRSLKTRTRRIIATMTPFFLLVLSFIFLLPSLGFELFPSGREDSLRMNITAPESYTPKYMTQEVDYVEKTLINTKEILDYTLSISENKMSLSLNLTPWINRQNNGEKSNDEVQEYITQTFTKQFAAKWYGIGSRWGRRGPWGWDPVGIFITSNNANNYNEMIQISEEFEKFLSVQESVWEVNSTAKTSVWGIEYSVNKKQAALLWLNEKEIFSQVSQAIRWKTAGNIKGTNNDHDIKVYIDDFLEEVTPWDIENIQIYVGWKAIKAGNVISYEIVKTSPSITRWDGDIQVGISASLKDTSYTAQIQSSLEDFAKNYEFPLGITYKKWWENEENAELINSLYTWVFIAFFLIFSVLVYQFNSYGQPIVILYSVLMSIIWVIIWLYVTWNPLSMPVGIWFISLMWIVVNDAIIMVDKINKNLSNSMEFGTAIIEWAVSRLNPILVTTITTAAWILPIALQDPFWAGLWFTIAFWLTTTLSSIINTLIII